MERYLKIVNSFGEELKLKKLKRVEGTEISYLLRALYQIYSEERDSTGAITLISLKRFPSISIGNYLYHTQCIVESIDYVIGSGYLIKVKDEIPSN